MSTYYAQQPWSDGPGGNTPVTATTLTHVETGLGSAHDRIDALAVGSVLIPTAIRTTATAPAAGQLVTYDASSGNIGPIPLPVPSAGVIMSVVKGDATTNTVTLTSGVLLGNGGSTSIVLRTVGESRALYGSASGWFVSGAHSPIVGTTAGTVAAGDDGRFANTLTTALYGGPSRTYPVTAKHRLTTDQFLSSNSNTQLTGWTSVFDKDSIFSVDTWQIPMDGRKWRVHAECRFGGVPAGGYRYLYFIRNATSVTAATILAQGGGQNATGGAVGGDYVVAEYVGPLGLGDQLRVFAAQATGASLAITANTQSVTYGDTWVSITDAGAV